ncbi:MAG TPA: hypothetical protein VIJ93_09425, partial [bacterium]
QNIFRPGRVSLSVSARANEVISGVVTYNPSSQGEIYGLIGHLPVGAYLKLGSFNLPYGLTLADDNSLTRTLLGFNFDGAAIGNGVEFGIYPDVFFLNMALVNGDNNTTNGLLQSQKTVSLKGGINLSEITLGGSFYGSNLDEPGGTNPTPNLFSQQKVLYNVFGWGRIWRLVFLGEYDQGFQESPGIGGVGIQQNNLKAYHASVEADLGNSVYLRLTSEVFEDSLKLINNTSGSTADGFRHVLSIRCYPVRNLRAQIDFQRMDPNGVVNQPNYALMADAFVFF